MMEEGSKLILERMLSEDLYLSPYRFALWAYPWGEGDLREFDGPRVWQREVMEEIEGYLRGALVEKGASGIAPDFYRHAVASGRGPGKSALVGMLAHWFISTRIGGSVWVAANGEAQLRTKTFPEISKWVSRGINREFFDLNVMSIQPATWFKNYIESPQGLQRSTKYYYISGQIWSEENPDAFAGAHNFDGEFSVFDESSGIPDSIWTVQEGVFTENIVDRFWLAFSNPRRNEGAFYDCFNRDKRRWRTTQIDSRKVEGISLHAFNGIIEKYGVDSDEAKIEVYGQFPSVGEDQYISPKVIDGALERLPVDCPGEKVVVGVDVARFGSDRTVFAVRKGSSVMKWYKYQGLDTMAVVGKVIEVIREWKPDLVIIDEGGLGSGVLDRLIEQGYRVKGVQFGGRADNPAAYLNKRAEMWARMRDWLRSAAIGSTTDNAEGDNKELKQDLMSPRYTVSSSGSVKLESKKDMKKRGIASSDYGDALALTLAYPCGDNILRGGLMRLWPAGTDMPKFLHVVQSYVGAFTEKTVGKKPACTTWGVFDHAGKQCVMLLDCWTDKLTYPEMRDRIIRDWHAGYGVANDQSKERKPDLALVAQSAGESMVGDLRNANIQIPRLEEPKELIESAHQASTILSTGIVYVPESRRTAKSPVTWASELLDQFEKFPNDDAVELVDTFTRAMLYLRDSRLLELSRAELDDPEEYEKDYGKAAASVNPYAC